MGDKLWRRAAGKNVRRRQATSHVRRRSYFSILLSMTHNLTIDCSMFNTSARRAVSSLSPMATKATNDPQPSTLHDEPDDAR